MKETKKDSLLRFLANSFWLQRDDFWILALVEAGVWAAAACLMAAIIRFSGDPTAKEFSLPGLMGFIMALVISVLQTSGRFVTEFNIGVRMSQTRRRMLLSGLVLSTASLLEVLALAVLLNGVWQALVPQADDLLAHIPAWGWAAAVYAPLCLGLFCGAVLLRFGQRGFWWMYAVFMVLCLGPQMVSSSAYAALPLTTELLLGILPYALPLLSAVPAAAGIALLRRAPILA